MIVQHEKEEVVQTRAIRGLTLYFNAEDQTAANLIGEACDTSVDLIHTTWNLETPANVCVYVMTSWLHFVFHSAPWTWRVLLAITLPLWVLRMRRMWQIAGRWRNVTANAAPSASSHHVFYKLQTRALANASSSRVSTSTKKSAATPATNSSTPFRPISSCPSGSTRDWQWSRSTSSQAQPTVQPTSLETLALTTDKINPRSYRGVHPTDPDGLVYLTTRGYWITRYLEATNPGLLQELLSEKMTHAALEDRVAAACGIDRETFWRNIDQMVVAQFAES